MGWVSCQCSHSPKLSKPPRAAAGKSPPPAGLSNISANRPCRATAIASCPGASRGGASGKLPGESSRQSASRSVRARPCSQADEGEGAAQGRAPAAEGQGRSTSAACQGMEEVSAELAESRGVSGAGSLCACWPPAGGSAQPLQRRAGGDQGRDPRLGRYQLAGSRPPLGRLRSSGACAPPAPTWAWRAPRFQPARAWSSASRRVSAHRR